jgi:inorganic phosphate transporter, PiT family
MISQETILFALILLAGFYMAWSIGANDVANAMGTSVGSGALTIRNAVMIAAVLEFCGAFFFGSHVSTTIEKNIINADLFVDQPLTLVLGMLAALLSAGLWLHIASFFGWPVSTTHSLIGALVGFGITVGGVNAVYWSSITAIVSSWIVSPFLGGLISYLLFFYLRKAIFYKKNPVAAAKKLTPIIAFFTALLFCFLLLFEGTIITINPLLALLLSALAGFTAAFIGFMTTKDITYTPRDASSKNFISQETTESLEKAKKHLMRAYAHSSGEIHYQTSALLEEIQGISTSAREQQEDFHDDNSFDIVEKIFKVLQIFTAALMAFSHGANDVANAIGPLVAAVNLLKTGRISESSLIPYWALALGATGIIIGLATLGWKVIHTIGKKLTELTPSRGFVAEFGAAFTILIATRMGLPISTTHTLVGSVIGVGMARGLNAINLNTTRVIVISWIVTVPAGALLAVGIFHILRFFF